VLFDHTLNRVNVQLSQVIFSGQSYAYEKLPMHPPIKLEIRIAKEVII